MENHASLFVNTSFIIGCTAMAIVFITIPLPSNKGLKKYRISLRLLACAYLALAILKASAMAFNLAPLNLLSLERLTISSLQASLFTIALITLLRPGYITRRNLYIQIIPVFILNFIYWLVASRWGSPVITNYRELSEMAVHPSMLIREFYLLFYIAQLVYLTHIFKLQVRIYENEIDNYFADSYRLHLSWVKYCYLASLSIGISAIIPCLIATESVLIVITGLYTIFYLVFGICYIQYPSTYLYVEPVIYPIGNTLEETSKSNRRLEWEQLKKIILIEKYYLNPEVNIEDMARHLKIGRTTLSKFINNEEKMNFNGWINNLRIDEAKQILLNFPKYTLIEISEMVGYSESSNFSRQFKHITNVSPSVWRLNFIAK